MDFETLCTSDLNNVKIVGPNNEIETNDIKNISLEERPNNSKS